MVKVENYAASARSTRWARFRRAKPYQSIPGGCVSHARLGAFSIDKNSGYCGNCKKRVRSRHPDQISTATGAAGVPVSSRLEMVPPLSFTWRLREQVLQGHLLPEWDPYEFGGYPWVRFLAYPVYFGVALATLLTGLSIVVCLVGLYLIAFALSARITSTNLSFFLFLN